MSRKILQQFDYIDALRGWAILGVVVVHVANTLPLGGDFFNTLVNSGSRGVQLFYIVSSLTIFMSLASRKANESLSWLEFFIRRFMRIAPMFYLAAAYYLVTDGRSASYFAPDGMTWWTIPLTFSFMHGWHPETINSLVPGGWSIAVEATFYVLVPFIFLMIKSTRQAIVFVVCTFVLMLLANEIMSWAMLHTYGLENERAYLSKHFFSFWFFSQLPVFSLGILAFFVIRDWKLDQKSLSLVFLVAFAVAFLSFSLSPLFFSSRYIPIHVGCAVSFLFLILALRTYPFYLLVNPLMINLGKISFSVYLVHFAVIKKTAYLLIPSLSDLGLFGFAIYLAFTLGVSIALASIFYKFIELPFMALGRHISKPYQLAKKAVYLRKVTRLLSNSG